MNFHNLNLSSLDSFKESRIAPFVLHVTKNVFVLNLGKNVSTLTRFYIFQFLILHDQNNHEIKSSYSIKLMF